MSCSLKKSSDTLEEWDDYFVKLAPRFTLNLAMGVIYFLGHANCCTNFATEINTDANFEDALSNYRAVQI